MLKYHGRRMIRFGFIGTVLIVLVVAVGLQPERLVSLATTVRYHALFTEAGGLQAGNDVIVSGVKVGTVSDVTLQGRDALVTFGVDGAVELGSETTAHIRTGSLLGQRIVTLESAGSATMNPLDTIPVSRTASPYSLTEVVGDLTTNVAGIDTEALSQSLDVLSDTIDHMAPQLKPTFDGLARLSRSLNERDNTLKDLLASTQNVTGVLAQRSQQLNALILNANDLLDVLATRRHAIVELLANVSAVSKEISGIVDDNEPVLAPTLKRLNSIAAMLEKNRDNLSKAIPGLAKFMTTLGDSVSSGPFYQAAAPLPGALLQPFFDYAFGFRRGVDAGQPPDNAGPRAVIPFPYNGIPRPNERGGG
jgi:phospholipid/cholesterol/gamma-HCH transport system substrate-binding protein